MLGRRGFRGKVASTNKMMFANKSKRAHRGHQAKFTKDQNILYKSVAHNIGQCALNVQLVTISQRICLSEPAGNVSGKLPWAYSMISWTRMDWMDCKLPERSREQLACISSSLALQALINAFHVMTFPRIWQQEMQPRSLGSCGGSLEMMGCKNRRHPGRLDLLTRLTRAGFV